MNKIPINYSTSFVLFWGLTMGMALLTGGILNLVFVLVALLMMIWHEHAHAKFALRRGAIVQEIGFTWIGGYVMANFETIVDMPDFFMAGVKNTGALAVSFIALDYLTVATFREMSINLAMNPYLNLLDCIVVFAVLLFMCNILPIAYHWKEKDVLITTDAWAAYGLAEARDELFNDMKYRALV